MNRRGFLKGAVAALAAVPALPMAMEAATKPEATPEPLSGYAIKAMLAERAILDQPAEVEAAYTLDELLRMPRPAAYFMAMGSYTTWRESQVALQAWEDSPESGYMEAR